MKPVRVLHIGSGNLYGGVETLLVTLYRYRALAPAMEPEFTVCFEGRLSAELEASGALVHKLGPVRARNPVSVWRARRNLQQLLAGGKFDVVICHSAWTQAIFGPVVRERRVPLLIWMHGPPARRRDWLEYWAQQAPPEFVICNSRYTASQFARLRPSQPHEVVYGPVPAPDRGWTSSDRSTVRRELETPEESVVIIQVSRMEAPKGHRLHLEALMRIRDIPGWTCWFVGGAQRPREDEYSDDLKRSARSLGISERVRFVGQRSDVQRVLAAADIFCQPNLDPEPFGIVFIEALWAGLPVVTTAIGGGAEIVAPGCGMLVPPSDADLLGGAMRRLIADAELRCAMSLGGRRRAAELCAPAGQLPRLAKIVQGVVDQRIAA